MSSTFEYTGRLACIPNITGGTTGIEGRRAVEPAHLSANQIDHNLVSRTSEPCATDPQKRHRIFTEQSLEVKLYLLLTNCAVEGARGRGGGIYPC